MSPIDDSRWMQAFAANPVHGEAVLAGQVQFRLAPNAELRARVGRKGRTKALRRRNPPRARPTARITARHA